MSGDIFGDEGRMGSWWEKWREIFVRRAEKS
jgi:hypothetical protein